MPYSRYDRRDSRKPDSLSNVNPWENGFPQGSQHGGPSDQLSLAGNLLGQILGRTAGVGSVGANLATSLVMASALQSQNRGGLLPLGGGAFNNQSSFNSNRGRDFTSRSSRMSPSRSRNFRRSRSRSRDRSRRGGNRGEDRKFPAPHKRIRSPAASAAAAPAGERPAHEIYIGNYPVRFRENDVRKLFEEHDVKVLSIRLKHDGLKVFAFAETENKEEIEKAVKAMDSKEIAGRRLRVRSAKDKDKKTTTTTTASSSAAAAPRPAPKKVAELNEGHVTRHLAFAFVGFLERQMTSEGVPEEDIAEMNVAKEAIKKAFKLPEDDSLKITRRLELIFMQNNRREIKPPQDEVEEEAKAKDSKDDKDVQNESIDQDFEQDDDSGNWKRRKIAKDDDEDEEEVEAEADGTKTSDAEIKLDENEEEEEEVADHREEVMTVIKSATEAIEASKALVNADDDDDDVLEIEDDQGRKEIEEEAEKKPEESEKGPADVEMEKEENDGYEENSSGFDDSSTKTGRGGARGRGSGRARRSRGRRP